MASPSSRLGVCNHTQNSNPKLWFIRNLVYNLTMTIATVCQLLLLTFDVFGVKTKNQESRRRRRSSVNFRGQDIFARKICMKNYRNTRILHHACPKNYQNTEFWYLPEKNNKISRILHNFCPKNARILHNCQKKKFFHEFYGGHVPSVSYACESKADNWLLFCLDVVTPYASQSAADSCLFAKGVSRLRQVKMKAFCQFSYKRGARS